MFLGRVSRTVLLGALAISLLLVHHSAAEPAPERVTLTGWLSCTTCFEPGACKAQTRWSCTLSRVAQGASFVLVVNDKHYVLAGMENELSKAAAENSVTITGDLTGHKIAVTNVEIPPKKHRER